MMQQPFYSLDVDVLVHILMQTESASDMRSFFACDHSTNILRDCKFLLKQWVSARSDTQASELLNNAVIRQRIDQLELLLSRDIVDRFSDIQLSVALQKALRLGAYSVVKRILPFCKVSVAPGDEARLSRTLTERDDTEPDMEWGCIDGMVCDVKVYGVIDDVIRFSTHSAVLYNDPQGLSGTFYMFGADPENQATSCVTIMLGAPTRVTRAKVSIGHLSTGAICIRCVIGPT